VQTIEETFEQTEERLKNATTKLEQVMHMGDESERYENNSFLRIHLHVEILTTVNWFLHNYRLL
jgi:hypothetical protein